MLFDFKKQDKQIRDGIEQVEECLTLLAGLPEYDKEKFEAEEAEYWKRRLLVDAECHFVADGRIDPGTLMSLKKLGFDPAEVRVSILQKVNAGIAAAEESLGISAPKQGDSPPLQQ